MPGSDAAAGWMRPNISRLPSEELGSVGHTKKSVNWLLRSGSSLVWSLPMATLQTLSCRTWQKLSFLRRPGRPRVKTGHKIQVSRSAHKPQPGSVHKALIGVTVRMAILSVSGLTETHSLSSTLLA
jgi:hypothetical protein